MLDFFWTPYDLYIKLAQIKSMIFKRTVPKPISSVRISKQAVGVKPSLSSLIPYLLYEGLRNIIKTDDQKIPTKAKRIINNFPFREIFTP